MVQLVEVVQKIQSLRFVSEPQRDRCGSHYITTRLWKSDKDYMNTMVKDHEKDLAAFEKEAKEGSDPKLKSFADKTAKIVREHLQMAKETDAKLK